MTTPAPRPDRDAVPPRVPTATPSRTTSRTVRPAWARRARAGAVLSASRPGLLSVPLLARGAATREWAMVWWGVGLVAAFAAAGAAGGLAYAAAEARAWGWGARWVAACYAAAGALAALFGAYFAAAGVHVTAGGASAALVGVALLPLVGGLAYARMSRP